MPEHQLIEKNKNIAKRDFFDFVSFRSGLNFQFLYHGRFEPLAPKMQTVLVSLAFVLPGLFALISPGTTENGDWFLLIGYVILAAGVFIRGL